MEDGYAVTKASEIETKNNQALTVMLTKDRLVPAEIVKTFPLQDLALIKLADTHGLTPVPWVHEKAELPLGMFLSAAGSGPDPIAIGVVSVSPRNLASDNKGFLGVALSTRKEGVLITQVLPGGAAAKAGLKQDDIITKLEGETVESHEKLAEKLSHTKPGDQVILEYLRDGVPSGMKITLGDRSKVKSRANTQNHMGTEVSEQHSGYQHALQTDLPISPEECGGPVVDLEGNVVGITIARAGRISTYALLADDVRQLLEPELDKLGVKKAAPQPATD